MADRRSIRGGFTLAEVLVTLAIMSMLLASISQMLTAARNSRDTIQNIQETHLAGPAILDLVERDLRGLLVLGMAPEHQLRVEDRVALGFDADSLDFVTTTDGLQWRWEGDRAVRADWGEVGYRLRPNPENDDFLEIFRRESFGCDSKEGEPFDEGGYTFLHDRVKGFDILVYPEDGPDAEPVDEWGMDPGDQETQGLPARLEITLTIELAPRIAKERLTAIPLNLRTVAYTRVVRLPQTLRVALQEVPRVGIPSPPSTGPAPGGAGGEPGAEGGGGDDAGGDAGDDSGAPGRGAGDGQSVPPDGGEGN